MLAGTRVDALNPERAEIALADPAIAIGILQALLDPLFGDAVDLGITAPVTLGCLENLFPARVALDGVFCA